MISKAATLSKKIVIRPTTLLPKRPRSSKVRCSLFLLTKLLGWNSISRFLYALFSVMTLPGQVYGSYSVRIIHRVSYVNWWQPSLSGTTNELFNIKESVWNENVKKISRQQIFKHQILVYINLLRFILMFRVACNQYLEERGSPKWTINS